MGLDIVSAHERDPKVYLRGMQAAVDAVTSGKLDPSPLYTHRFPLAGYFSLDAAPDVREKYQVRDDRPFIETVQWMRVEKQELNVARNAIGATITQTGFYVVYQRP